MKTFLISIFCLVSALAYASPLGVGDPATARLFQSETSMIGWWRFNETSGSSASDSSGNNYTGTLVGSAAFNLSSVLLSGASDRITTAALLPTNVFSISLWFNTTTNLGQVIFSQDTGGDISLMLSTSGVLNYENDVAGKHLTQQSTGFGTSVTTNEWHHLLLVEKDAALVSLNDCYLDGVKLSATNSTVNANPNTSAFTVGGRVQGGLSFSGWLDDVRVFPSQITAEDTLNLFNEGRK